ncbi:DUF2059 domain-containing protein [Brevundimonas sp.]|uniref:DUF2059 domain-containing protein n=1 Tax=Brevundimonas sp. TaxID=1871086 RepID=UPI003D6CE27E
MRKFSLIVAISMSLPASFAHAQEGVRAQPPTSDMLVMVVRDDPRPALAEQLVQMTLRGMDKFTQEMLTQQLAGAEGVMPEEQARWLRRNAGPIADSNLRSLVDAITHEYATRFTEAELNALIAFYGGPLGQDIARKQMEAGGALGEAAQKFQIAFATELMTKFCGQFDCEGEAAKGTPTGKPSRR